MDAGIDDVGIGILFGLYDWHYEILALMEHIKYLENKFGVGPHTISVPRLEPADGSTVAEDPPYPVSDIDFKKITAILRLAVPYTGIIMSTRETAQMRRETFALGVSQISAGSRTNPGGYIEGDDNPGQFSLGDHRNLDEVIKDVMSLGYIPSFCTGCYRLGRTGEDFMDLAKPGLIKLHCQPNAMLTLKEYLLDFGDKESISIGNKLIADEVKKIPDENRKEATLENIKKIERGERDLYF
jgi:2-iminoacetate synthase